MRFTHANRHCPDHPYVALKRNDDDFVFNPQPEEQSIEILKWLQKYREERQQMLLQQQQQQTQSPSTSRKTPKRPSSSSSSAMKGNDENKRRVFGKSIIDNDARENNCDNATAIRNNSLASPNKMARSKGLMCEMDLNVQSSTPIQNYQQHQQLQQFNDSTEFPSVMASPISTNKQKNYRPKVILWKEPIDAMDDDENLNNEQVKENTNCNSNSPVVSTTLVTSSSSHLQSPVKKMLNPKKKWLREAWQEQDHNQELAQPLDFGVNHPLYKSNDKNWQMSSSTSSTLTGGTNLNPNQNRPSVLVMTKDKIE